MIASSFTVDELIRAVDRLAAAAQTFAAELNEADGRLGDGDLGITLSNGWRTATQKLAGARPADIAGVFLTCAMAFQESSASSFGTLTATGLMAAAKASSGRAEMKPAEISGLLRAAMDAMARRGKAEPGDKTVLDSLAAMAAATTSDGTADDLRKVCVRAASEAAEQFRSKANRIGRARMFGEDSIGIVDPGMLAALRMAESV